MKRVVLDCRWLFIGGAGRTTELLLRALASDPPEQRWLLWGSGEISARTWPNSEPAVATSDPRRWKGQRDWFRIPPADAIVFLHQQRPLRRMRSATLVYDTIPLRFTTNPVRLQTMRLFLRRVGAISERILTLSEYSRRCIERDLGVPPERISVLGLPADPALAERVVERRARVARARTALYVGRFAPHKNLRRLVSAFSRTAFAADGGRLLLVGGTDREIAELSRQLPYTELAVVDLRPPTSQEDLEGLLASCLFLVQASLEEGFGLPAWEALTCGLPVCVSDGGSLPEVTLGLTKPFPAGSTEAMIDAIDACADEALRLDPVGAAGRSEAFLARAPTFGDFRDRFLQTVESLLR